MKLIVCIKMLMLKVYYINWFLKLRIISIQKDNFSEDFPIVVLTNNEHNV
jgi:hypothetical protein